MSLWDWISSIGDPEAQGAAQASTAMQPAVQDYLHKVVTGQYAGDYFSHLNEGYDPNASFAQNAQNPTLLQNAMDVALGFSGGGLGTRAAMSRPAELTRADPAFGTTPFAEAKFPQYAEQYPPVGPPTPTPDPRKGPDFMFPAKTPLPEVEPFLKERARIQADMNKNGYTPYYDPAGRYNVDPANYPAPTYDTATISPGPRAKTTAEQHMENIGSDDARARLQAGYQRGLDMGPDTGNWYAMGQREQDYINQLGPEAGRQKFMDEFATGMAAVTSGNPPGPNFLLSHYLNFLRENNLPYPTEAHQLAYPVGGGKYGVMPNVRQHQAIMDAGGYSALTADNPKRYDFTRSFLGDLSHPVMDEQMTGGMTPGVTVPPGGTYGLYSNVASQEAAKRQLLMPGDFQDVAWAGLKNLGDPKNYPAGRPMIQELNESIERTHRLTGMPRDEIAARSIGSRIPLYGLLGGVGLGAAGYQDQ